MTIKVRLEVEVDIIDQVAFSAYVMRGDEHGLHTLTPVKNADWAVGKVLALSLSKSEDETGLWMAGLRSSQGQQ